MNSKEYKSGIKKALDILNRLKRYNLCWEQMDESENGEFVTYKDIKDALIWDLQKNTTE